MDLENPLSVVSPTLDARVLAALARRTDLATGREIHRRAGGSQEGVRQVLARLTALGIVVADVRAHAILYRLNVDHLAAGPIVELVQVRQRLMSSIADDIAAWGTPPLHASLFGSFARGESTLESDIDVLVVCSGDRHDDAWMEQVAGLSTAIERWTGNVGDVVDADTHTLTRMIETTDPLLASWRSDHIHISGERLHDVLRGLGESGEREHGSEERRTDGAVFT